MLALKLDVRTKLILILYTAIVIFAFPSAVLEAVMLFMLFLLNLLCSKSKAYVKYAIIYLIALGIQCFVLPHLSGTALMTLSIFAVSFRRLLPCVMAGSLLLATTTASELMYGLQKLRIPRTVTIPLAVTMRYLPAVREELQHIHDARQLRRLTKSKNPFRNFAQSLEYYYVPLLISAAQMSDEITAAAVTRGIENPGKHTSIFQLRLNVQDYLIYVILLGLFVTVCIRKTM